MSAPYADAARLYRDAGWLAPLPVGSPGEPAKAPVPKGTTGHDAKVPTDRVIESWIAQRGECNIALHMSDEIGVIGVDIDAYVKNEKVKRGDVTIEQMEAEIGCELPDTWMSTARGGDTLSGIHFYRVPPGNEYATKYTDVEIIQPKHRYGVVWPSVNPETGEVYRWYPPASTTASKRVPRIDQLTALPKAWLEKLIADARRGVGLDKSAGAQSEAEVNAWLSEGPERPCRAMRNVADVEVARFGDVDSGARYDTMVEGVMALVRLASEGHHGVGKSLARLQRAYEQATADERGRDTDGEWWRALSGAVSAVSGSEAEFHSDKCPDRAREHSEPIPGAFSSPNEPANVAAELVERVWGGERLKFWRGDFYEWTDTYWRSVHPDDLRAIVWRTMADASWTGVDGEAKSWSPTKPRVANVIEALQARVHRAFALEPDTGSATVAEIPYANGVLELTRASGERVLREHSPAFFNTFALPFDFNEGAGEPKEWLAFLATLDIDADVIALLQEWFGCVVAGDVSHHKMMYLYGDTRAGKGVITRVLQQLVGHANHSSPNLAQFGETFGLQSTVGKALVTVNDARFRGARIGELVERLLNFTGGDEMDINRKNKEAWRGIPGARVMIVSNDLPGSLGEQSTAFANRILGPIELHKSFLDAEDLDLERRLRGELGEIIMWAFDGYDRLCEQERFTTPVSSRARHREMTDAISPVRTFVVERCVVGPNERVGRDELYRIYREWAQDSGLFIMNKIDFGRQLRSAVAAPIKYGKTRVHHARVNAWVGIGVVSVEGNLG